MSSVIVEGIHPVVAEVRARLRPSRSVQQRSGCRLGLVIEGGGMRGIVSGAGCVALERLGLTDAFDGVYAESAGAINGAFFLAGEASLGIRIYTEDLTSQRFINPFRLGRALNLDYLVDEVMTNVKPLTVAKVKASRTQFFVSVTDALTGGARSIDVKREPVDLLAVLKGSAAILPLYNHAVAIGDGYYVDGGISDPIPIRKAIEDGCTHILVLMTREQPFVAGPFPRFFEPMVLWAMRRWSKGLLDAYFHTRWQRYNEARLLAAGKGVPDGVQILTVWPSPAARRLGRMTMSRALLAAAEKESIETTMALLSPGVSGARNSE